MSNIAEDDTPPATFNVRFCNSFAAGSCSYGQRCRFAHADDEDVAARLAEAGAPPWPADRPVAQKSRRGAGAAPADAPPPRAVLFVSGLPQSVRSAAPKRALQRLLRLFGPGVSVKVGVTGDGHCRGWAHVALAEELADAASSALHGQQLGDAWPGCVLFAGRATDKRDTLFPWLCVEQRVELRLDATALFSALDGSAAERTVHLMATLMDAGRGCGTAGGEGGGECGGAWVAADACACGGGSALALARSAAVACVAAVEIDEGRAASLAHNSRVALLQHKLSVTHGDWLAVRSLLRPTPHLVFIDPPWGGTDYAAAGHMAPDALGLSGEPLRLLIASEFARGVAMVGCGTPRNYDDTGLARAVTACAPGADAADDRPLPFRLEFGARVLLLFLSPAGRGFGFPTRLLDDLVATVVAWNAERTKEHHPRFFDWEKDRWISLSRWLGARPAGGAAAQTCEPGEAIEGASHIRFPSHNGDAPDADEEMADET